MSKKSTNLVPITENISPQIQNMRVDKDKLDRPYAKVESENGE